MGIKSELRSHQTRPEADFSHDPIKAEVAKWKIHTVSLVMTYVYSDKTIFSLGGSHRLQDNGEEKGRIETGFVGVERTVSEKTSWELQVGLSSADYDDSGSEVKGVSQARIWWKATDKLEIYAFGRNAYQPGYRGGAAHPLTRHQA